MQNQGHFKCYWQHHHTFNRFLFANIYMNFIQEEFYSKPYERLVNLSFLVILLLNLSLNAFQTQANILRKPLMLLLRLTVGKESTCYHME
ncbi:hypothetical protein Godav_000069 [Gossypium davidsonii]|uniref:Uncharacterized protein n=2 Tax=Gossypium TaxID=3633 RepID=A0A7J8T6K1_GOSDV|nr:hypothetical protein [Gossypium davidsonii]